MFMKLIILQSSEMFNSESCKIKIIPNKVYLIIIWTCNGRSFIYLLQIKCEKITPNVSALLQNKNAYKNIYFGA